MDSQSPQHDALPPTRGAITMGTERKAISCSNCGAPLNTIGAQCRYCDSKTIPTIESLMKSSNSEEAELKELLTSADTTKFQAILDAQIKRSKESANDFDARQQVEYSIIQNWIDWLSLYLQYKTETMGSQTQVRLTALLNDLRQESLIPAYNLYQPIGDILPILAADAGILGKDLPAEILTEISRLAKEFLALPKESPLASNDDDFNKQGDHLLPPNSISRQLVDILLPYRAAVILLSKDARSPIKSPEKKKALTIRLFGIEISVRRT